MSTNYYRLRLPMTSIRLDSEPGHDRLTIFECGANAGTLTLSVGRGPAVALCFADSDERPAPLRTYWGGTEAGTAVTVNDESLPDDTVVVSEYGDVLTVADVKRRAGAGRHAKTPNAIGELFGYTP